MRARPDLGPLRAEEEDQRRIVGPHEQDHERTCRSVGRSDAAAAEVEADRELAEREEHGRREGSQPHVAPLDAHVGQVAEHQREERAEHRDREHQVHDAPQRRSAGQIGRRARTQREQG